MQLHHLVRELSPLKVVGATDCEVAGITFDSRRVFPGMVFVALPGRRVDGHDHVSAAIDRGACAVVCERNGFASRRATQIKVPDSRVALARAAAVFYGHPSRSLRVAGITGTNGKTTVSFLLGQLLVAAGRRPGLVTTVRYEVGDRMIPAQRTTPESVELQAMMAQMVRVGCDSCVLEVSSHALVQRRVDDIDFHVGVFTNLTEDHLDFHGTATDYFEAKRRLFAHLESALEPGVAVVNLDDPWGRRLLGGLTRSRRLTFGLDSEADVRGTIVQLGVEGSELEVGTPAGSLRCRLPLLGRFNVSNALAAVASAVAMGVPLEAVQRGLGQIGQIPGRLERIDAGQPFSVLVDYAHTEDALRNVLGALREVTPGRLLLVLGCGGDRDPAKRLPMGRTAGALADEVIVTSDNPRHESPGQIAEALEEGLRVANRAAWLVELDRGRAIEEAVDGAQPGDTVLIAGKGHESYQEFADTVVPFDDRAHAREALANRNWRRDPAA